MTTLRIKTFLHKFNLDFNVNWCIKLFNINSFLMNYQN